VADPYVRSGTTVLSNLLEIMRQRDVSYHKFGIVGRDRGAAMKLSDLPTHEQVLAGNLDADSEYRREWERTALARAVAVKVISYRAERGLSQAALAKRLHMTQPAIARLESGEHNPTFPTLLRLSHTLGIELAIDIAPTGKEPQLIGQHARRNALESFEGNRCSVIVAAA
jgi:ribosome-binding protein aMBF1 (putative translation factor)